MQGELLRGGSAGRRNRWIGPASTAPSLEDGTGRGPTLVPALEQDPAGAERIVGVPQHLDDSAKRPTPLSELRHLGRLRRTLPPHLTHLSFRRNAKPDRSRPGPARTSPSRRAAPAPPSDFALFRPVDRGRAHRVLLPIVGRRDTPSWRMSAPARPRQTHPARPDRAKPSQDGRADPGPAALSEG